MKKLILLGISLLVVLMGGWGANVSAKTEDQNTQEGRLQRLGQGETLTDGGYLKKGVWGDMEGVVEAPPEVVWRLFIHANDWMRYRLPELKDCRTVNEAILNQVKDTKKLEDFYQALGNQVIDPLAGRQLKAKWENYTFQLYNMPWPVSDKWFVIQNFADETRSDEGIFVTKWEKMAGNVRVLHGELDLTPFEGDKTKTLLHYHVDTDPGPIPRFLVKWGVKKSLPAAMTVIRREAIRMKGRAPL